MSFHYKPTAPWCQAAMFHEAAIPGYLGSVFILWIPSNPSFQQPCLLKTGHTAEDMPGASVAGSPRPGCGFYSPCPFPTSSVLPLIYSGAKLSFIVCKSIITFASIHLVGQMSAISKWGSIMRAWSKGLQIINVCALTITQGSQGTFIIVGQWALPLLSPFQESFFNQDVGCTYFHPVPLRSKAGWIWLLLLVPFVWFLVKEEQKGRGAMLSSASGRQVKFVFFF